MNKNDMNLERDTINYMTAEGVIAATTPAVPFTPKVICGRIGHPRIAKLFRDDYELLRAKDDKIVNLTPTLVSLAVKHVNEGIISGHVKW